MINIMILSVLVVVQSLSRVWLCDPMDCSTPGFPVLHHLLELAQTHGHWVSDAIQTSRLLSSSFPSALNISQNQAGYFLMSQLFTSVGQSTGASASVLPVNIQDWFPLGLTGWISFQSKELLRVFSNITVQKHHSSALSFLYRPTLTSCFSLPSPSAWGSDITRHMESENCFGSISDTPMFHSPERSLPLSQRRNKETG